MLYAGGFFINCIKKYATCEVSAQTKKKLLVNHN